MESGYVTPPSSPRVLVTPGAPARSKVSHLNHNNRLPDPLVLPVASVSPVASVASVSPVATDSPSNRSNTNLRAERLGKYAPNGKKPRR